MAFWSGSRFLEDGAADKVVRPFDPERIDCSAYTLTLGEEAYITPSYGDDPRQSLKKKLAAPNEEFIANQKRTKGGGQIVIPAGQFAFLLTEEIVAIPRSAMGFISLKSAAKFRGLINVSGFHVDPGFEGRLIYSVFNAGPTPIQLARGDLLFLLWIADLSGKTDDPKYWKTKPGYAEIPTSLIAEVSKENHSLQALSGQISDIAQQFRIIKGVAAGVATAIALFLSALALQPDEKNADSPPVTLIMPGTSTASPSPLPALPAPTASGAAMLPAQPNNSASADGADGRP